MSLVGFIGFLDPPKESAKLAIEKLNNAGIRVIVLTGDNVEVTKCICDKVGIKSPQIVIGSQIDKLQDRSMNIKPMTIAQSLNKAYLKQDISITDYNRFIQALRKFFKSFNTGESEENQKNTIAEFLRNAHYQDKYLINTNDKIDQAIYHGPNPHDPVAVLIEAKRLSEKKDMISIDNPNAKAMQEAIS